MKLTEFDLKHLRELARYAATEKPVEDMELKEAFALLYLEMNGELVELIKRDGKAIYRLTLAGCTALEDNPVAEPAPATDAARWEDDVLNDEPLRYPVAQQTLALVDASWKERAERAEANIGKLHKAWEWLESAEVSERELLSAAADEQRFAALFIMRQIFTVSPEASEGGTG